MTIARIFIGMGQAMLLTAWLSGCGYSHRGLFPADVATVQVPIMANRTEYRGLEFDLTEALIKEMELRTPYKMVSGGGADTVLQGEIRDVSQTRLSRTSVGGLVEELEVKMVVDFTWKDARTGRILRQRSGLADVGRYIPATPLREPLETARHEVAQRMAERIVSSLRDDL